MTRRRWIANAWDANRASLTGDQAAHLARVLRAQPGMRFDVVAGEQVWEAEVIDASESLVRFALLRQMDREQALPVTLLLAVFKFDRLEWAIEKLTELGVERIVPVLARRTEKHLAQAAPARLDRWRRIAREAAQQSRRADVPLIDEPFSSKQAAQLAPGALRFLLSESEQQLSLRSALANRGEQPIAFALGPEGGWTDQENALFLEAGWIAVSLGPRILRAETAAISATAILAAWLASS